MIHPAIMSASATVILVAWLGGISWKEIMAAVVQAQIVVPRKRARGP